MLICAACGQVEALAWSLVSNAIVVLPTGTGKTLVASLFLARMAHLNPGRMVAMIVDRIPLVQQQVGVHLSMRGRRGCDCGGGERRGQSYA